MFDIEKITEQTFVDHVDFHSAIESTNDRALELAGRSRSELANVTLVLAEKQTRGRGRGANAWWSSDGALTFSVLLAPADDWLPKQQWPLIALATGLAVRDALERFCGPNELALKWPNDVYLSGRKVCGILVESPSHSPPRIIVGIGINVANSFAQAPHDIQQRAISLVDATTMEVKLQDVLLAVLQELKRSYDHLSNGVLDLQNRWSRYCLLSERSIEVTTGNQAIAGTCRGVAADGALLVMTEDGEKRILSGVVTRF